MPNGLFRPSGTSLPVIGKGSFASRNGLFRITKEALPQRQKGLSAAPEKPTCCASAHYASASKTAYLQPERLLRAQTAVLQAYRCIFMHQRSGHRIFMQTHSCTQGCHTAA